MLKKDIDFEQGPLQQEAIDVLKLKIILALALISIDYSKGVGQIILAIDTSGTSQGVALIQAEVENKKKRYLVRFESSLQSIGEAKYNTRKRKYRSMLRILKKLRSYIYGVYFLLEVDANILVYQLNKSPSDLLGSVIARQVAQIQLFDFEVVYIPSARNIVADSLSRRERTPSDDVDNTNDVDLDDVIDAEFFVYFVRINISFVEETFKELLLDPSYSEESQEIAVFLSSAQRLEGIKAAEFKRFKKNILRFVVKGRQLQKKGLVNRPLLIVVDSYNAQEEILNSIYKGQAYIGRDTIFKTIAD